MATFRFPDIQGQMGLASTKQLLKAGASEWDLTQLAVNGQRVVRSVYRHGPANLSPRQLLIAGALWSGTRAVMTGAQALSIHGLLPGFDPLCPPRFLVPVQLRDRRNTLGMITSRTRIMPRSQLKDGLRVAVPDRALVDACREREVPESRLKMVTMTMLQRRLTTLDRLEVAVAAQGDALTGPIQDAMLAFRAGAWSPAEETLIKAVASDPGLPFMHANITLEDDQKRHIGIPDGYFEDSGVAVQVHSRLFHTGEDENGRDRWVTTIVRDVDYQAHGIVVVPVAPETLDSDIQGFLGSLRRIVAAHAGRGPKHVRIRPRPPRTDGSDAEGFIDPVRRA